MDALLIYGRWLHCKIQYMQFASQSTNTILGGSIGNRSGEVNKKPYYVTPASNGQVVQCGSPVNSPDAWRDTGEIVRAI